MYVYSEYVRHYTFKNMYMSMYIYLEYVWVVKDKVCMYALMIVVFCRILVYMR